MKNKKIIKMFLLLCVFILKKIFDKVMEEKVIDKMMEYENSKVMGLCREF